MLRITELKLPLDHPEEALRPAIVQRLGIANSELLDFSLFKRSYDARKRFGEMPFIYTLDCTLADEATVEAAQASVEKRRLSLFQCLISMKSVEPGGGRRDCGWGAQGRA